jgi:hypothetical protein
MMRTINVLGCALALVACAQGGARSDRMAPVLPPGWGADAGTASDAGTPVTDAGAGDGDDASAPVGDGGATPIACEVDWSMPPEEVLPRCASVTHDCLAACSPVDFACARGCLAEDATPAGVFRGAPFDCEQCVAHVQMSCLDTRGCHSELETLTCCAEEKCGGLDQTCMSTDCPMELEWLQTCANRVGTCGLFAGEAFTPCFEAP